MPSPYGRQRPTTTAASRSASSRNSRSSRDLPIPAGPVTVTSRHRRRSRQRFEAGCGAFAARLAVPPAVRRAGAGSGLRLAQLDHLPHGQRAALSRNCAGGCARRRTARPTRLRVCCPIRISPGVAADCRRAAVFTASPATMPCPTATSPAATSPLLTPIRTVSPIPRSARSSGVESRHPIAHLDRGPQCPKRVVLVQPRAHRTPPSPRRRCTSRRCRHVAPVAPRMASK